MNYYQGQRVVIRNRNDGFKRAGIQHKPFTGKLKYMNDSINELEGCHGIIKEIYRFHNEDYYKVYVIEANMHFDLNGDCFE